MAAVARNGVIGLAGGLPWRIPEDAQRFRTLTMGHAVVMGRRTWDSLPRSFRPLPGRRNMVVTRNRAWQASGAEQVGSLSGALDLLEGAAQVFVIGGGELYADALARADELLLTEIDAELEGDTYFPAWERAAFEETSREAHVSESGIPFAFVKYVRRMESGDQASA